MDDGIVYDVEIHESKPSGCMSLNTWIYGMAHFPFSVQNLFSTDPRLKLINASYQNKNITQKNL